ncbi:MAG TPA: DNA polymerase III subunit gamma/tau [Desulfatiglandales bacterium]|nr:DNA polymerase III subunit gamma/tau [Desulfatiglandales bacterium]
MPYEVFARKWRPQLFEEVIGQEPVAQTLKNALTLNRLAHAYLFTGARGVGKTSVARILAKALNCSKGNEGNPCNKCSSCVEITSGSSVDVQEIDGASNRGIEEIRNIRENIRYMPSHGAYRIYIIDEVHMLTLPAFNALLKTLEEPPEHAKFIFATTEPHKIPVTILSRCQRFDFKRIPLSMIEQQIKKIIKEEGISVSDTGISIIAREAEGSMRDAESLLDQVVSFTGSTVEDRQIIEILGIIDRDLIYRTSQAIIDGDAKICLHIIDEIYNYGYEIKEFYREIMDQFRNLIVSLIAEDNTRLMDLPDNELEQTKKQAQQAGMQRLLQSLNFLITRESDLRYTTNPRIALEAIFLKLLDLKEYLSFDEVLKKIEDIEKRLNKPISYEHAESLEPLSVKDKFHAEKYSPVDGKTWNDFLRYVTAKNRMMANVLREWKSYNVTAEKLELSCSEGSFTGSYFYDSEHYDQLVAYARDFFQPNFKVVLTKQDNHKELQKSLKEDTLSGTVKDIIDIFEGKIVKES